MAIAATFTRTTTDFPVPIFQEVCSCTLSGTYATGGFTWTPLTIKAGPGTSPMPAKTVYTADFYGQNGYNYITTFAYSGFTCTATTTIWTSGGTLLANTTAVPDTTLTVVLLKGR